MMKKKFLTVAVLVGCLSLTSSITAFAGWEQAENLIWKYKDDTTGVYATSQWIESITEKGVWYYVNEKGVMITNDYVGEFWVNEKGEWRGGTQSKPSPAPTPAPSGGGNGDGGGKTGLPTDDPANEIDRGQGASDAAINALKDYY